MKKILLIVLLVSVYTCANDTPEPYDPVAQLQIDLGLIDAHLAEVGKEVIIHSSGIRFAIENEGDNVFPVQGDSVATQYDIYTLDGVLIDTTNENIAIANGIYSASDNYERFVFKAGAGNVIEGFEIGTGLLSTGAVGTFYVPSTLAYKNSTGLGLEANQIFRINIQVQEIF